MSKPTGDASTGVVGDESMMSAAGDDVAGRKAAPAVAGAEGSVEAEDVVASSPRSVRATLRPWMAGSARQEARAAAERVDAGAGAGGGGQPMLSTAGVAAAIATDADAGRGRGSGRREARAVAGTGAAGGEEPALGTAGVASTADAGAGRGRG